MKKNESTNSNTSTILNDSKGFHRNKLSVQFFMIQKEEEREREVPASGSGWARHGKASREKIESLLGFAFPLFFLLYNFFFAFPFHFLLLPAAFVLLTVYFPFSFLILDVWTFVLPSKRMCFALHRLCCVLEENVNALEKSCLRFENTHNIGTAATAEFVQIHQMSSSVEWENQVEIEFSLQINQIDCLIMFTTGVFTFPVENQLQIFKSKLRAHNGDKLQILPTFFSPLSYNLFFVRHHDCSHPPPPSLLRLTHTSARSNRRNYADKWIKWQISILEYSAKVYDRECTQQQITVRESDSMGDENGRSTTESCAPLPRSTTHHSHTPRRFKRFSLFKQRAEVEACECYIMSISRKNFHAPSWVCQCFLALKTSLRGQQFITTDKHHFVCL